MFAALKFISGGFFAVWLTGCSALLNHSVNVPVVTDTGKLLAMEQQKNSWDTEAAGDKLKNMTAAEHLQEGQAFLRSGDLTLAKLHLTLALAKDDSLEEAYLGLGEVLIREGKIPEAKTVLVKALLKKGEHVRALARMGTLCRAQGELEEAVKYLRRADELKPDSAWLLTELAMTYERSGETKLAESYLERVVQLLPNSPVALNNLGFNYVLQRRYPEAIPLLQKALQLDPGNRLAMNNLALACALTDDQRTALRLFEVSVGKAGAYNNLGYLLMLQQHDEDAERALARALELSPRYYARAKENLELLKENSGDPEQLFE